jgi:hypothetical protein
MLGGHAMSTLTHYSGGPGGATVRFLARTDNLRHLASITATLRRTLAGTLKNPDDLIRELGSTIPTDEQYSAGQNLLTGTVRASRCC